MPEFTRQRKSILSVFDGAFVIMIIAIIPWADKFGIYIFEQIHMCNKASGKTKTSLFSSYLTHSKPSGNVSVTSEGKVGTETSDSDNFK